MEFFQFLQGDKVRTEWDIIPGQMNSIEYSYGSLVTPVRLWAGVARCGATPNPSG